MGLPGRAEPPKPVNLPATTELTPGTSCCKPGSPGACGVALAGKERELADLRIRLARA
jgi:hypothetical protein